MDPSQWNRHARFNGTHGDNDRASRATAQGDEEDQDCIVMGDTMDYMPADIYPIDSFNQLASASVGASNDKTVNHKSTHKSIVSSQNPYEEETVNNYSEINGNGFLFNSHMLNPDDFRSEATGYDAAQAADIDADAAFALQLQQEEYAKESMASFRRPRLPFTVSYEHDEDGNRHPSQSNSASTRNDELLARQLYRDEQRQRPRFRPPRAYVPHPTEPQWDPRMQAAASRRSDDDRPEILDIPSFFQVPPHALVRCRGDNEDDDDSDEGGIIFHERHPMFSMMAHPSRAGPMGAYPMFGPFRSRYRRGGNLQDTEDDFGPEDYERLLQLDDNIKKKKLDKKQINSIKTETFSLPPNNTDEENQCAICLERFKVNESLRRYPCTHLYHQGCSDRWLQENNVCPICRKPPVDVTTRSNSQSRRPPPHHDRSNHHRTSQNRNGHGRPPAPNNKSSRNSHQS